jgi:hypothetical protein
MIIFAVFLGRDSMPLNMRNFLETAVRDRRIKGVSKRLLACLSGFFCPRLANRTFNGCLRLAGSAFSETSPKISCRVTVILIK